MAWNTQHSVGNVLTESEEVNSLRQALNEAPFAWSAYPQPTGLFTLPAHHLTNTSFASTAESSGDDVEMAPQTPEKKRLIPEDDFERLQLNYA